MERLWERLIELLKALILLWNRLRTERVYQ